jgi:hypothetical protein
MLVKKGEIKMSKNKTATLFALFLMFAMISSLVALPAANAHTPAWQIPTYAFVNAAPNPAGVGQPVNIGMWINNVPPTANRQYGDRWNFKVTVTKPNGDTEALGTFTSDDTGGTHTEYTPDTAGNYTFFLSFPGQTLAGDNPSPIGGTYNAAFVGDYFEPSNASTTLTVQEEPVPPIPQTPLPTNYWTRPIESVNLLWYTISGAWLGLASSTFSTTGAYNASGNYNPYTTAPTTAHIMWTQPAAPGGLIGGEFGATETSNFNAPTQYQPKFDPIIMNGILYYQEFPGSSSTPTGWTALDLKTGQTLWTKDINQGLMCGQLLDYVTPNQYGALAYLWGISPTMPHGATIPTFPNTPPNTGTTYSMYDATTGKYILSIVNGTGMTLTEDEGGNLIGYYVNFTAGTQIVQGVPVTTPEGGALLECWNSTVAVHELNPATPGYSYSGASEWYWQPTQDDVIPFSYGIVWAKPIGIIGSGVSTSLGSGLTEAPALHIASNCIEDGVILMTASSPTIGSSYQTGWQAEAGYDVNTGEQLWITNRTETPNTRLAMCPATAGVYAEVTITTFTISGYSMKTGKQVWGPFVLPNHNPYDSIGGYQYVSANGTLYLWGLGGDIYAIDMATGDIVWATTTEQLLGPSGSDTPYGVWPTWTFTDGSVAGGMLFVPVGHQYSPPMFRGANLLAINITDGQLVWKNMGFDVTCPPATSDGVTIAFSSYDNQIYAYGLGPTKTTVTAPSVGVTTDTPVTISGTVTDISAGSQQNAVAMNFPNGLPCVSDASMSDWMQFVYEQQPCPANVTGVPVTLSVLDSNGNQYSIGTAMSDGSGTYSLTWTPKISGNFTVYASFAGSESYYPSSAEAHFYASAAPTATPAPTPQLASLADIYFLPMSIVILIAIIVATIVMVLMLRKR